MKDKVGKKLTMNDVINEYKDFNPVEEQRQKVTSNIKEEKVDNVFFDKLKKYNENFPNISEEYNKVKPLHSVLVRVKVKEPEISESGLVKPYMHLVKVPTKSGYGTWAEVESTHPYDTVGVVVAKPESITLVNVGDTIVLTKNPVEPKVIGESNEAMITIPFGFVHPSYNKEELPRDPDNPHYGYLLLPVYEIKAVL